jgi:hypothetical protein
LFFLCLIFSFILCFLFFEFTSWNLKEFLPKVQMPNYSLSSSTIGATFDFIMKSTDFPHETD